MDNGHPVFAGDDRVCGRKLRLPARGGTDRLSCAELICPRWRAAHLPDALDGQWTKDNGRWTRDKGGEGIREPAVLDAVAVCYPHKDPAGDGSFTNNAQLERALPNRRYRLDPPDEVYRYMVGDAHQNDDLGAGSQTRCHNPEYGAVSAFCQGARYRCRPRRRLEPRLGGLETF